MLQELKGRDATFSQEFKSLMTLMFKAEPDERPSIDEILKHDWMTT